MNYYSTRDHQQIVSAAQAIACGLAPDGGLFVPESLPEVSAQQLQALCGMTYQQRAVTIMRPFLSEFTDAELERFTAAAYGSQFDDPAVAPVHRLDDATAFLELWHGPTCAFKDMALQILPYLLTASLKKCGEQRQVCILVATSGDTGKAALQGFADVPGTKILVFYPYSGVSEIQRLQMATQAGDNVAVSAVRGNFDDAQTGVKQIFGDKAFAAELSQRGWFLSSANSINWGRLLPQIVYYFSAYCDAVTGGMIAMGDKLNFVVPTGNFGDILAGWYAKEMGLPVGKLICASNANNVLTDFIRTGTYNKNRPFHTTASPSMDILVSSNLERLLYALCGSDVEVAGYMQQLREQGSYTVSDALKAKIQEVFAGGFCNDIQTREKIGHAWRDHRYLIDTHTAVAYHVLEDYRSDTGCRCVHSQPLQVLRPGAARHRRHGRRLRPGVDPPPVVRDADRRARAADRPGRATGALRRLCGQGADAAYGGRIPEIICNGRGDPSAGSERRAALLGEGAAERLVLAGAGALGVFDLNVVCVAALAVRIVGAVAHVARNVVLAAVVHMIAHGFCLQIRFRHPPVESIVCSRARNIRRNANGIVCNRRPASVAGRR